MLMFGKMSVGVRRMVSPPRMAMSIAITAKVYGRRSASRTIHMLGRALRLDLRRRAARRQDRPTRRSAGGRRHELRPDRVGDALVHDGIYLVQGVLVERPPHDVVEGIQLLGAPGAPECDLHAGLIEDPADGECEDALAVALGCEAVERSNGPEILRVPRRLKLGVRPAEIVTLEPAAGTHASREQATTEGAVGDGGDAVPAAVGQHADLGLALEDVVRRLPGVQRRD